MQHAKLVVSSPAFLPGEAIPSRHSRDHANTPPPLRWSGVPDGAQELVLMVEDADSSGPSPFTHWLMYGLPPSLTGTDVSDESFAPEQAPAGMAQGRNSLDRNGYDGPFPPPGRPHHYYFVLYALDKRLNLDPGATRAQVLAAMRGHVIAQGELMGLYGRLGGPSLKQDERATFHRQN